MIVSEKIDPDFPLTAPMMFLKYFVSCDIELKFRNDADFEKYLTKNPLLSNFLQFRVGKPPNFNEELF